MFHEWNHDGHIIDIEETKQRENSCTKHFLLTRNSKVEDTS